MNNTLSAIATASALVAAGGVSAHCAFHTHGGYQVSGEAMTTPTKTSGSFIRTGGRGIQQATTPDIVDTAVAAGSFSTLVKAVRAAGLVETLRGDGPFIVFAPPDEAFARLPSGTLEALLADKARLAQILTYHVVPGKLDAAKVNAMSRLATVAGSKLSVDSIRIAATDIMTSNGIIHVIDDLLIPSS